MYNTNALESDYNMENLGKYPKCYPLKIRITIDQTSL